RRVPLLWVDSTEQPRWLGRHSAGSPHKAERHASRGVIAALQSQETGTAIHAHGSPMLLRGERRLLDPTVGGIEELGREVLITVEGSQKPANVFLEVGITVTELLNLPLLHLEVLPGDA